MSDDELRRSLESLAAVARDTLASIQKLERIATARRERRDDHENEDPKDQ